LDLDLEEECLDLEEVEERCVEDIAVSVDEDEIDLTIGF